MYLMSKVEICNINATNQSSHPSKCKISEISKRIYCLIRILFNKLSRNFVHDRLSNICQKIASLSYTLDGHLQEAGRGFVSAESSNEYIERKEEKRPNC